MNHPGDYICEHRNDDGEALNSTVYTRENSEDVNDYEVVLAKVENLKFWCMNTVCHICYHAISSKLHTCFFKSHESLCVQLRGDLKIALLLSFSL